MNTKKQFKSNLINSILKPGYFGLSDDPDGCKPCDCSPGGSFDMNCDVHTGQCKCKPNMDGRTCDKPVNGYFCPTLDHFVYEAENAKKLDLVIN
jgi:laminin beta 1